MMTDKTDGREPAFPAFHTDPWNRPIVEGGMTLRDYFAGQALVGDLASYANREKVPSPENAAKRAYAIADALLKERDQ